MYSNKLIVQPLKSFEWTRIGFGVYIPLVISEKATKHIQITSSCLSIKSNPPIDCLKLVAETMLLSIV